MSHDPLLTRITPLLAAVSGIAAIVLGGSRARGTAHDASDYDIGLYYADGAGLDTDRLHEVVKAIVDEPDAIRVTPVGEWGPWIVGGAWLVIGGRKVDLLYRSIDKVTEMIERCRSGDIGIYYQPGHPHGFCSATWMGEVAQCHPLHDPDGVIAALKASTSPYPRAMRDALIRRFQWEILFSIENAETALPRGDSTHIAGCAYRALACLAQVCLPSTGNISSTRKARWLRLPVFP
ncbi:nucleotidyltransferase domain-containing protein [Bradyrhizobium valentinum]|uniref:nucleotidyltransferase domain-containing protein n=1 Tax=Bradyrhizobium valentinum TaxID=1518501 RepID=UPI000B107276|nr:nucleotidyltransferase domain-containing protein [Bradyrhizobium valentinum]